MNIHQIKQVYFIGIGGIGMSALARYFMSINIKVAGYDKTPTQLTDELQEAGMDVHFEDNIKLIPSCVFDKTTTLIVVTPAIPKNHSEWNYFEKEGYEIKKRAEVLGLITKDTYCFAVAGTHGKTTTSSILGHILFAAGTDVTAFLGGIVENYQSNLIGNGRTLTVVEADEFDRSFLKLHPNMACITSMDADHLDIYGDKESIENSFKEFASKVNEEFLFVVNGLPLRGVTVGINDATSDFEACNIRIEEGYYVFDVKIKGHSTVKDVVFGLPGHHNLINALMAFGMAMKYGIAVEEIKKGLAEFRGVRRRFSFQIRKNDLVYIDDYAHHPTEINAVHQAVRELYPEKKIIAAFQPHLFSRTRDFVDGFAESLSAFDEILLLDIYPARELPIEGVNSEWLLEKITSPNKKIVSKEQLKESFEKSDAEVFVTIGAGDIGEMVKDLKKVLNEKS